MRRALILVLASGCSFLGVRGPSAPTELIANPGQVHCTDSDLLPELDALAGVATISVAGGGVILQHTSDDGAPRHFDLYYAPLLLAASILLWSSASFGTNRVEHCREVMERAAAVPPIPDAPR